MSYIHKNITACLITLLLLSCETNRKQFTPPDFKKNESLKYEVLQDTLIISYPYDMVSFDNYIVIFALMEGKWLQVYDKQTGEHLGGYVGRGQGPGEIIAATYLFYNSKERILTIFENNTQENYTYKINENLDELIKFESKKNFSRGRENRVQNIFKIDDNHYLLDSRNFVNHNNTQRFSLETEVGDKISEYNDFATSSKLKDGFWAYCMQQSISISPNKQKMACVTFYGGVLETFEIDNSINLIQEKLFYPIFMNGQKYTEKTVFGFVDICTSDEYIYTVLIGNKDLTTHNNISVFDWNGEPVVRYATDVNILRICYNENDNSIYAIAIDDEFYLIKFGELQDGEPQKNQISLPDAFKNEIHQTEGNYKRYDAIMVQ